MAESTAIFHEYGGTENQLAVAVRHGIYVNVAETVSRMRDKNKEIFPKLYKKWVLNYVKNVNLGTNFGSLQFLNLASAITVAVKFLKWRWELPFLACKTKIRWQHWRQFQQVFTQ